MNVKIYNIIKRIFDIIVAAVAIIVLFPIGLIAIIGIEVSDPGPIFYFAKRLGKGNRIFTMLKFRSMRVDKNANEKSLRPDQERIFGWGKFMRKTKIDEIPQFINVLKGDMSIIGPRPAAVEQKELTRSGKNVIVAEVLPGLSGPSALYDYIFGDRFEMEEEYNEKVLPTRLLLDICYLRKRTVFFDIKMLWYTFVCIVCTVIKREPSFIYNRLLELLEE